MHKEFIFINSDFRFLSGIELINLGQPFDIELQGSYNRIARKWDRIPYKISSHGNITYIKFIKSVNYLHLKLILSGIIAIENFSSNLIFDNALNPDDIKEHLSKCSIILTACARNCISSLDESINTLLKISQFFKESRILIFENDSVDGTAEKLMSYHASGTIELIQENKLDNVFPLRTQRLSYARNQLINHAQNIQHDYYCTMDIDGVLGHDFNFEGFLSCFKFKNSWDAVFPINQGIYYDVWAFRHDEIWPFDYQEEMNYITPQLSNNNILDFYVSRLQNLNFKDIKGWLKVSSAFGGVGLYKSKCIHQSNYFGLNKSNEMCEHTVFHEGLVKSGAHLYINPEFIISGI